MNHRAGFVSIIGKPNAGKSTLMNTLVGEKLSVITPKAQTTRHRIIGIYNDENHQVVFSDTPGIMEPKYELHNIMLSYVDAAIKDADMILLLISVDEPDNGMDKILNRLKESKKKFIIVLNKSDIWSKEQTDGRLAYWKEKAAPEALFAISATNRIKTDVLFKYILEQLPESPPFYDKSELTDRSERFFASEIIREKIFLNYEQEIPYSCDVTIEEFKEKPDITVIRASIVIERDSQKGILIGEKGSSLKKVGVEARQDLEKLLDKKVFLELHVKVQKDWRKNKGVLKFYGYS
jgi:GTPase